MSGVPTNDVVGNLLGKLLGTASQDVYQQHMAQAQMAMANGGQAWSPSLAQRVAQASYPPERPNMTGTEFIKASLRVAMEREMRLLLIHLTWIFASMMIVAVCLGFAVSKYAGIVQLGFLFGFPVYSGALVLAYCIRKQVKKWIERHLS